jgi:hypothetical protein
MFCQVMAQNFVIADLGTDAEKRSFLNSMTKPNIKAWLRDNFKARITNFDRTAKHAIIEHFVKTWNDLMKKQDNIKQLKNT